ncbi:hypothetical protein MTR_6g045720 [Medicago truncatula]|uniref:Uncharacterized protein n=1 Tax=Medicago truncatula TaxID=3880 RepID=G7KK59_MEDTR|nr:hypothetical protein MTR_6g045720 [Medicago truncatula]
MSLTFAWTALLGFQSIETLFFCLRRLFSFDGQDAPVGEKSQWKLLHHPLIQPRIQGTQGREGVYD